MAIANFVIAGTEKAGTTSVFSYLARHPEVAVSRRKETNFFRRAGGTAADYARHFPAAAGGRVVAEASPAYLGEADSVVPRMRAMIPDARLLFILRDPVARLHSSYQFHRAKLNLPENLDLHQFVRASLAYAQGAPVAAGDRRGGIDEWYLRILSFGCYAGHLRRYYDAFPAGQIKVAFYDDLRADPCRFMEDLSGFLDIDPGLWADADFSPVNVTFSGRNRHLHRLAVAANERLEPLLRPRPRLKSFVVSAYKRLNCAREGYGAMSDHDRRLLEAYYGPHNRDLERLLGSPLPAGWAVGRHQPDDALTCRDEGEYAS